MQSQSDQHLGDGSNNMDMSLAEQSTKLQQKYGNLPVFTKNLLGHQVRYRFLVHILTKVFSLFFIFFIFMGRLNLVWRMEAWDSNQLISNFFALLTVYPFIAPFL